jgi:hypothetical protein
MPRIIKYETDSNISDSDVLLGSDGDNENVTKKFTVGALKAYIIPSGGQAGQVLKSDGIGGVYWDNP